MSFPGSPILLKGALVSFNLPSLLPSPILFQYNPDTMTRKLEARASAEGGDRSETLRLTGAPKETITFNIEIDAADQLEKGDPFAALTGVNPALASLELLLYPKRDKIVANTILAQAGNLEIIPVEAPLTIFVWGARVVPVRINDFTITEEAFDQLLNPTRAKVDLTLHVLSYNDLKLSHPGRTVFSAYHISKEVLVRFGTLSTAFNVGLLINPL
jgi:hypothetical protein